MFLPNVDELTAMAMRGYVPETVYGSDRPRMAVRLFDARDALNTQAASLDWGSERYSRVCAARDGITVALAGYAEYANRAAASARS